MSDETKAQDDEGRSRGEARSGVRLSRLKSGERTWNVWLSVGDDPAELRATIAELQAVDAELERAYGKGAPAGRSTA